MTLSANDKEASQTRRDEIEGRYTFWRIAELESSPVQGNFDTEHLKEVNRRIFQDLPKAGFDDVTPGEFRKSVGSGGDWIKQRGLLTVSGSFFVAYSKMDENALARLDRVLEAAKPEKLRVLKTPEFIAKLASIYVELDYVHPFSDGNSRTLRTLTRQIAKKSGYELDWGRFGSSDIGRDLLYIARDLSENELALPLVQHENTMRKISLTQDRLKANRALPELLVDAIRPSRAVAFEQMTESKALKAHPELNEAYKTMHKAVAYYNSKMPDNQDAREGGIESIQKHVQSFLDIGEIDNFSDGRSSPAPQRKTSQQRPGPEPEHG